MYIKVLKVFRQYHDDYNGIDVFTGSVDFMGHVLTTGQKIKRKNMCTDGYRTVIVKEFPFDYLERMVLHNNDLSNCRFGVEGGIDEWTLLKDIDLSSIPSVGIFDDSLFEV